MANPVEDEVRILYAVYPGLVPSKHDGDLHRIDGRQLMMLYGVDPRECVTVYGDNPPCGYDYHLIPLRPRYDGDYDVARVIQDMPWED